MSQKLAKNKIEEVYFSYDDLNIYGVLNDKVYVMGYHYDEKDERVDCLLGFTKPLFKDTMELWLKDKEDYCERYKEFCGAMGSIISDDFTITDQEVNNYDHSLRIIIVNSIKDTCDMEHG